MLHELSSLLQTLAAKWPSLTTFRLNSAHLPNEVRCVERRCAGHTPLADLVAPLLSLRTLRSFRADFCGAAVLYSSADFRVMAEAWPDLETFWLHEEEGTRGGSCVDPEVFVMFARHCPRLCSLRVPWVKYGPQDASTVAATVAHPLVAPHPVLRELAVHCVCWTREPAVHGVREQNSFQDLMQKVFPFATYSFWPRNTTMTSSPSYSLPFVSVPVGRPSRRGLGKTSMLLISGRVNLFEKIPEVVKVVFLLVKCPFWGTRRLSMEDDNYYAEPTPIPVQNELVV
ncbi:hypothetical protein LXA43DRAFT_1065926 [Ganoderma leucocontextum]|nr:hypothetical protein LXA43DRAFT_1065926 [Ganoderma leucocontextum]